MRSYLNSVRRIMHRIGSKLKKNPDRFLQNLSGVIHVGANTGQERELYKKLGLSVIWIEPIPEVFQILKANLQDFPNQQALQYLVTDRDDQEYQFHVANNNGLSSSIMDLKQHKEIWPSVSFTNTLLLRSSTLVTLFEKEGINPANYQALILDVQGAELLVLRGCATLLKNFQYIKTEVADFESYAGCCQLSDLNPFMIDQGYRIFSLQKFASRPAGGSYFNIVYCKNA